MTDSTVTRLRPRGQPAYTDTAALNDIHALLTTSGCGGGPELVSDLAEILARAGRPMVRGRDIDATVSESPSGWPVARVDAEDTTVTVRQDPARAGLLIQITTRTPVERDQLSVTLDGRPLYHPSTPGDHTA